MINEKSVFIVPENVEVTTVDGDTVLLNFETGDFLWHRQRWYRSFFHAEGKS